MTDTSEHRLPREVVPSAYRVTVRTPAAEDHFSGSVSVDAEVTATTSTVVCSATDLEIASVTITAAGGPVELSHRLDVATERLVIDTAAPLDPGPITIEIAFTGGFNQNLVGMYRSKFDDAGTPAQMTVTQFEAPHARRVFPCWDEPSFKATYEISLEVDEGLLAISNGPEVARTPIGDGLVRFEFAPTMAMSTYLVAWVIGDLEVSRTVKGGSTDIRVIHRPGQGHLTEFALDCAAHAVGWFEEYYGIAYPGDKLDLLAIPDFAFGAMENLGCVTFREILLLIDPERANRAEQERAATVIEHEIAHMWFGDLVTMDWWDGIWLNEAFATLMEFCCADAYRPNWEIWTAFGLSKSMAFETDTLGNTRPIEYEVRTPAEAEGMFDILTYEKGASVLRMFEQWAGPETFRAGVRDYLGHHSYANTETADLWAALSGASGVDVGSIMDSWILQGGHPLVSVEGTSTGVRLTQQRSSFVGADAAGTDHWKIPMRLRALVGGEEREVSLLFSDDTLEVDLGGEPEWVLANAGFGGFFRTRYSPDLRAGLLGRAGELHPLDRYGLVDDAWALFLGGHESLDDTIETLAAVAAVETEPSVWRRISGITGAVRVISPDDRTTALAQLTRGLVGDRLTALAGRTDLSEPEHELHGVLLRLAGTTGRDERALAAATAIFEQVRAGTGSASPEVEAAATEVVAANGGVAEFEQVLTMFRTAPTSQEELRALSALAQFPDPELIARFCRMCLAEVRTQNSPYALAQAMGNRRCGEQAWEFVAANWDEITTKFPSSSIERLAGGVRAFSDPALAARIHEFFAANPIGQAPRQLAQHLERLRVNAAARERVGDSLDRYLDESAPDSLRP